MTADVDLTCHEFNALVDTGATRTSISQNVVNKVGLERRGTMPVGNVKRTEHHHTYHFYVGIWPETQDDSLPAFFGIGNEILGIDGGDSRFYDVLLGMDIISQGCLRLDLDGSFELGFPD
ncbi:retroviral-like aspartic protease family protein [Novosphingobium album (ex Liu et al. 2023)]|uniref:retroviral-like aspartic protease family protein n=1 Tax=Novosphingobium album (ex Liu et al. 2023) TaxID=3031130 RepID=UPI0023B0A22D|nr:retroviral-like aspartic protease family protein [Novosphingobium album (ex Liu et al. 2023)]